MGSFAARVSLAAEHFVRPSSLALLLVLVAACSSSGPRPDAGSRDQTVVDVALDRSPADSHLDTSVDSLITDDSQLGAGQFGDPCQLGSDCAAGHCLPTGRCSKPCTDRSDCPSPLPWNCATGGSRPYCTCQPRGVELCDRVDDDCDGVPDNGAACGVGRLCVDGSCLCGGSTKDCGGADCTNITDDPANCGDCSTVCAAPPFTTATCVNKVCGWECQPGYDDCDGQASNGCETSLATDPLHCGRCQHACICTAGLCTPELIATDLFTLTSFVLDATHLYWGLSGDLPRWPIAGGSTTSFSASYSPEHLAIDADNLYLGTNDEIIVLPKSGGAAVVLATGQGSINRLAVDATHVYWTTGSAELRRVAKSGGSVSTLVAGMTIPRGLAVNGQEVFWGDADDLYKAPATGGTATLLAKVTVHSLVADATDVYLTDYFGKVQTIPTAGGALKVLASGQNGPRELTVDATHVYWPTRLGGTVMRVPKGGGAVETIAQQQNYPWAVEVDATHVYWANLTALWRAPK